MVTIYISKMGRFVCQCKKAKFLQVLCNIKYDVLSARVSVVVVPFYWWLCLFMELRFLPELSE